MCYADIIKLIFGNPSSCNVLQNKLGLSLPVLLGISNRRDLGGCLRVNIPLANFS